MEDKDVEIEKTFERGLTMNKRYLSRRSFFFPLLEEKDDSDKIEKMEGI